MQIEQDFIFDEMTNKINEMHNVLVDIRDGTDDIEQVNELFRAIHTLKGAADLLFLNDIVEIAHKSEDLLDEVRNQKLAFDTAMAHLFIEIKDFLALILNNTYHDMGDDETIVNLSNYFETKIESFKTKSILIINDSCLIPDESDLLGYSFLYTEDISKGEEILNNSNVELLFIDIEDDDEKGISLIDRIKENSKYEYLPIVLLVSKNYPNLQFIGKLTGAKAWLEKPISKDKVLNLTKRIFG